MNKINRLVLYLYVFTVPFQQSIIIPGVGSLNTVFAMMLLLTTLITVLINRKIKKFPKSFLLLAVFMFISLASIFWSAEISDSILKAMLYAQLIFIFWCVYEFIDNKVRMHNVLKSFVLGCAVIAIQSLYFYFTMGPSIYTSSRFVLEGYNANSLGIILAIGLVISIYLLFNESKKYFIFLPLGLFVVLLTGSRTALIMVVLVSVFTLFYMFRYKVRFRKTIGLLFIVFAIYIWNSTPEAQLSRLSSIGNELTSGTLNSRTVIWDAGIQVFKENPVFGVGVGSFQEATVGSSVLGVEMSSHNSYLSILVENGLLGFLPFAMFLIALIFFAWKTKYDKDLRWLSLSLITLWLTLSLASHAEVQKYTWIIFGIIVSSYFISRKFRDINEECTVKNV